MSSYICGGSSFHPYECSHDKYCEHCTQANTEWHNPRKCAFCIEDGGPFVKEPFARRIRVWDLSHRYQKVNVGKYIQERLPV